MQDSVLAIETAKGLVGVESPAFTKDFQVWTNYLNGLEKPLNVVIFSNHPSAGLNAGEAWYGNTQTYASKNVQQAMQAGATKAIVDGLIPVYGKDFDASWAKITQILPLGKSNIASVTVDVQEDGAGNIIYFPELKAAYISQAIMRLKGQAPWIQKSLMCKRLKTLPKIAQINKVLSQPLRQNILSWQANNIWK